MKKNKNGHNKYLDHDIEKLVDDLMRNDQLSHDFLVLLGDAREVLDRVDSLIVNHAQRLKKIAQKLPADHSQGSHSLTLESAKEIAFFAFIAKRIGSIFNLIEEMSSTGYKDLGLKLDKAIQKWIKAERERVAPLIEKELKNIREQLNIKE